MNKHFCLVLLLAALPFLTTEAVAQNSGPIEDIVKDSGWKKRDQPEFATIDAAMFLRLDAINVLIDEEKYSEALTELDDLLQRRLTDYLEAVVFQNIAYVHARLGNLDQSIDYFERTLATRALTQAQHQGVLYTLATQYSAKQDFVKSIELMTEWFQYEEKPFADAFTFTGSCFAALERYEDALPFIKRAIEMSERPIESWYQMVVSLLIQLEKYEESIPYLKTMLGHWTKNPGHWEQLAGVYLEVGDDRAALDTMMIAYINGMVTSPQRIRGLVELNLVFGIPLTAGEILENEMNAGLVPETKENVDYLIEIWIGAREYDRAISAIDRIAKIADAGSYYMRAAQLSVQSGDWQAAAAIANKALDAGYEDKVKAFMMMGTAWSELGMHQRALEAFEKAREIGNDEERNNAGQWIRFIEESRAYERQVSSSQ